MTNPLTIINVFGSKGKTNNTNINHSNWPISEKLDKPYVIRVGSVWAISKLYDTWTFYRADQQVVIWLIICLVQFRYKWQYTLGSDYCCYPCLCNYPLIPCKYTFKTLKLSSLSINFKNDDSWNHKVR